MVHSSFRRVPARASCVTLQPEALDVIVGYPN
jgi:hypothetical protein